MRHSVRPFPCHSKVCLLLFLVTLVSLTLACAANRRLHDRPHPFPEDLNRLVVVGFRSAIDKGTTPEVLRSPISGDAFTAQAVPPAELVRMTDRLFNIVSKTERYDLVSPDRARGVYASLVFSNSTLSEIELLKGIGKAFSADAVLAGYLYRWREREGTDYAAKTPASVAFDLYLVRPDDGAVLWKEQFDMTQKSLSENLLEMDTFLQGGGRWMTAEELASLGLQRLLQGLDNTPQTPLQEDRP